MKLEISTLGCYISFIFYIQTVEAAPTHNITEENYIQSKLHSISNWLDSKRDSTIFDYILNVNYGYGLNLFQGDIKGFNPRHRTAVRDQTYLWNTRVVPYEFDPKFDPTAKTDVLQAITEYHAKTCIRFVPRTDQYDYLVFKHISGCYSNIGRQGGPQDVSLTRPCLRVGTAIHEMMHALGFWHEQSRPDRDNWIQVIYANIQKGKEFNFDKLSVDEVDTLGVQYDYGSIMHYSKYSFSKNGDPTILPTRNTNANIGQRYGLSPLDVKRINTLYRCNIPIPSHFLPAVPTLPPPTTKAPTTTKPTTTPTTTKPTTTPTTTQPTTTPTTTKPTTTPTTTKPTTTPTTTKPTTTPTTTQPTTTPTTTKPTTTPTTKKPTTTPTTTSPTTTKPPTTPTTKSTTIKLTNAPTHPTTQPTTVTKPTSEIPQVKTTLAPTTKSTTTHSVPTTKATQAPSTSSTTKQHTDSPSPPTTDQPTTQSTTPSTTTAPTTPTPLGWSSWSEFTPCDLQCKKRRSRICLTYDYNYCQGSYSDTVTCGPSCEPASYLGCWKVNLNQVQIPSVEGKYPTLTDNYQARTAAVRKCADIALEQGFIVFALYNYGMCLTGPDAASTFSKYGVSTDCGYRGKGGASGLSVYSFQKDIDGQFGTWTDWGQCTRSCGGGIQYRYRQCNNPPPIGNGAQCKGSGRESRPCNLVECSIDAKCGIKYYTGEPGSNGIIHMTNYINYMSCDYRISSGSANTTISLMISRIDIEYSRGCLYDVLTVYDGPDKLSSMVGEFCGNQKPLPFESSSGSLYVMFESDATGTGGGYTLEYTINSHNRKACKRPSRPGHSVMIGTSNLVGDRVRFMCDPGFNMVGPSSITCVDQPGYAVWSDSTPLCVRNFKRSIDSVKEFCSFDGNLCGFENDKKDDLDWYLQGDYGISGLEEYHLQTGAAKWNLPGDMSIIRSKIYTGEGETCIEFINSLIGKDNSKLRLYILNTKFNEQNLIWSDMSTDDEDWRLQSIDLNIHGHFRLVYEFVVGDTVFSSARLDNIIVKNGQCK